MRKVLIAALVVASIVVPSPDASAAGVSCEGSQYQTCMFTTDAPCAMLCPYWTDLDDPREAACAPTPVTVPGSFAQVSVTVPTTAKLISFRIHPAVDYDAWACRTTPNDQGRFYITDDVNSFPYNSCTFVIGCVEWLTVNAFPFRGQTIIFRVYNWLDTSPCRGEIWWSA